ncbi:MAG TPA: hypothetical protein VFL07_05415 [Rudaea sp.]|nr:hypothetical protein [Rudaea sp.]
MQRKLLSASAAWLLAFLFSCAAHAQQDGAYDPTFGTGGQTWINVAGGVNDVGKTLVRLSTGNFFMAGACDDIPCALWLTPDGAPANGFGISGTGRALFQSYAGWPVNDSFGQLDAAVLADGRAIVLTYRNGGGGYVAVVKADGTGLDTAVGNGAGFLMPSLLPVLVRVTPQQQVILVSVSATSPTGIVVSRYDSTLHPDTNFGTGGSTTIGFADGNFSANGATLQRDGKIVVVGQVATSTPNVGIIRLTAGGAPDTQFGANSDGRFEGKLGVANGAGGNAIAEDEKGRLVIAGSALSSTPGHAKWLVNRISSGGAFDATFNSGNPQVFTIFSASDSSGPGACCLTLQTDHRIVVAGKVQRGDTSSGYFGVARFLGNGEFDASYGIGGQSFGDMSTESATAITDVPGSMIIVPGRIIVGGYTYAQGGEGRFVATGVEIDLLFAGDFE